MSHVPNPPPKLTKELIKAISDRAQLARDGDDGAPASPLDWIAAYAQVKKLTIKRWMKTGNAVVRTNAEGTRAKLWIGLVDAVDALVSACADRVAGKIGGMALDGTGTPKCQLDALTLLQKRVDRHEIDLDAVDAEVSADNAIAHFPQHALDALDAEEWAELELAQTAMGEGHAIITAAQAQVDRLLSLALDRIAD